VMRPVSSSRYMATFPRIIPVLVTGMTPGSSGLLHLAGIGIRKELLLAVDLE
jgi:hypothetical protein